MCLKNFPSSVSFSLPFVSPPWALLTNALKHLSQQANFTKHPSLSGHKIPVRRKSCISPSLAINHPFPCLVFSLILSYLAASTGRADLLCKFLAKLLHLTSSRASLVSFRAPSSFVICWRERIPTLLSSLVLSSLLQCHACHPLFPMYNICHSLTLVSNNLFLFSSLRPSYFSLLSFLLLYTPPLLLVMLNPLPPFLLLSLPSLSLSPPSLPLFLLGRGHANVLFLCLFLLHMRTRYRVLSFFIKYWHKPSFFFLNSPVLPFAQVLLSLLNNGSSEDEILEVLLHGRLARC